MTEEAAQRRYPSPLRYPGGKGKVANYFKLLFLENDLVDAEYVEPYAGGAGVALALLYEGYASHVHINDVDEGVHAFWDAVLNDTDRLCARVSNPVLDVDEWQRQRAVLAATEPDPLDLAFATFYLNRTNRSGIIRGGLIGGLDQEGEWGIGARFNSEALCARIRRVARHRDRITLTGEDAEVYLADRLPELPADALVYLDPPYYQKGQGLYRNAYDHGDHVSVARAVGQIRQEWVVSYDSDPAILGMYKGYPSIRYGLSYSAQKRYRGGEVMFFKPGLRPPSVPSPANVRAVTVQRAQTRSLAL